MGRKKGSIAPNIINYVNGQKLGENKNIFIHLIENKSGLRKAKFQCGLCGNDFISVISAVKASKVKSCGCLLHSRPYNFMEFKEGDVVGENGLIYIKDVESEPKKRKCLFKCVCGEEFIARAINVNKGHKKSCGCKYGEAQKTHGGYYTPEYKTWQHMLGRCYCETDNKYPSYGARNITVCDSWRDSFENFIADVGLKPDPKFTLDRINNELGYFPENVRWASPETQANNRRSNVHLEYNGQRNTIAEWSRVVGIHQSIIGSRIKRGWSIEKTLYEPIKNNGSKKNKTNN